MSNLSPSTLALLRAAKNDAPSKEARAAIWGGVTSGLVTHTPLHITPQGAGAGPGAGASIAPAAGAAATAKGGLLVGASLTGMKGAFIGALFGSAISIGVATFVMRAKPTEIQHGQSAAQTTTQVGDASSSKGASTNATSNANANSATLDSNAASSTANARAVGLGASPVVAWQVVPSQVSGSTENSARSSVSGSNAKSSSINPKARTDDSQTLHSKKSATTPELSDEEMLSREASLVSEARRDLLTGDPAAALRVATTARALDARRMEPEEMEVQAKALRALGRDSDALKVESQLRTMYPGQTLGR